MFTQRDHRLSRRLYHSRAFTTVYERIVGRFSTETMWDSLATNFLDLIPQGGTILEIGAGPGLLAIEVTAHRPDLTVIASDFSPQMLALAEKNLQARINNDVQFADTQTGLRFVQADAMDMSQFTGQLFAGVYSIGAIKHFPEPLRGLQQCVAVLQPGGILYFTDFCVDGTLADTRSLVKRTHLPALLKFVAAPELNYANKREAPSGEEVAGWNDYLRTMGESRLEYSGGKLFFSLIFRKGAQENSGAA